jgi:N-acetylneuraminate synthase
MFNPYGKGNLPFVIAEIGINHNGDLDITKKLIDVAVNAGANAVKFQKRTVDIVYTKDYLAGHRESPWGNTQRAQKEGLEFGVDEYREIDSYCAKSGILWTASAWDIKSQLFLNEFNVPFNKVASAMITHVPFLDVVAAEGKHTFISTGMTEYKDIDKAIDIFKGYNCPFTLFHTVSTYPCELEDCNINMVSSLIDRYNCPVGYSGHEKGILPSVLAVAQGAVAIERHITLDRTMYGSDQSASLEPTGFNRLIRDCRNTAVILGDGEKRFIDAEKTVADKLRYF